MSLSQLVFYTLDDYSLRTRRTLLLLYATTNRPRLTTRLQWGRSSARASIITAVVYYSMSPCRKPRSDETRPLAGQPASRVAQLSYLAHPVQRNHGRQQSMALDIYVLYAEWVSLCTPRVCVALSAEARL